MGFVRPPAVAGSFYPADPATLDADLRRMLAAVPTPMRPRPKALIAPHAGYIYSGPIAASAYVHLAGARGDITRVVLIGPAHRVAFSGIGISSASAFQTPLGLVPVDSALCADLLKIPGVITLDAAHAQEHSLEVHLPFLQHLLDRFTLVPLVVGAATDGLVAQVLDATWGGPETLVVVSTDLSHYLDYETASRCDRATHDAILHFDAGAFDHHGACGRTPLGGLLSVAKRRGMRIDSLDLRNSGDTAGPHDRVVGYGAWALHEPARPSVPDCLLTLARQAIERHFSANPAPLTVLNLPELMAPGASFVTLHKGDQLRGCIGSVIAWRGLAEDVAENATKAAFSDPRFPPLTAQELPEIDLSISLLTAPAPMSFTDQADALAQIRPGIDGLLLDCADHRGLFLPAVWAQLPEKVQFLAHLKQKAGLPADFWSDSVKLSRFTAQEFHETK